MVNKDNTITKFLCSIKPLVDSNSIEIVDYWDGDLCAVGLKKGNKLVYISTYRPKPNKRMSYDYDLEIIGKSDTSKFRTVKLGRSVTKYQLVEEIKRFLLQV